METISFTIPGRVVGKGRPKFARRGQFVHAYTPAKTANAEAMIRSLGADAMAGRPPFAGPIFVEIMAWHNTPPSWSKKKRAEALYVTGKPDVDNVAKILGDALIGIVWGDDSQISDFTFRRRYRDSSGECVEVKVSLPEPPIEVPKPEPTERLPLFTRHRMRRRVNA